MFFTDPVQRGFGSNFRAQKTAIGSSLVFLLMDEVTLSLQLYSKRQHLEWELMPVLKQTLYSDACVKLGREMGVKVADLFTALQKRDACFTDGIHLSAEGSKIVVEKILKVIKEADWEPCLQWKSMPTEFAEDSPLDLVAADEKTTLNPSEWTFYREHQWD
ncbi:hypothetical protein SO802_017151 [Lithocarpus litseifolius]|uniref:Uncharacterized protein n=1 Tax=Lithocarpus litseifolius TaxID=425828 RepID=A0AAW2D2N0_9ROSI